ncbi:MAG TPA: hypothetical protein VFL80_00975 [Thermoanaerobaculia bacterium]|nr:hypothetical protein [Thermoanaerobaculia bacterium]
MRCLAVSQYRMLTTVRSAGWIFGISIGTVVLGVFGIGTAGAELYSLDSFGIVMTERHFRQDYDPAVILAIAARAVEVCYLLHLIVLAVACHVFSSRGGRHEKVEGSDLMDAAPITPSERYWGDAIGVFSSTMAIHLATLPLLAVVFALSPFQSSTFLWLELMVVALVVLESTAASWKFHASRTAPATARSASSAAIFVILVALVTISMTRWRDFRDAWAAFVVWPSPRAWSAIVDTVNSPALLVAAILALYGAFITFYYYRAVRAVERA